MAGGSGAEGAVLGQEMQEQEEDWGRRFKRRSSTRPGDAIPGGELWMEV